MQNLTEQEDWSFGKHALITGGSSGIGKEVAFGLIGKCRKLTIVARGKGSKLEKIVEELKQVSSSSRTDHKTIIDSVCMDIREYDKARKLINGIYEQGDQIDIFVNCAGGSHLFEVFEGWSSQEKAHSLLRACRHIRGYPRNRA